MLRDDRAVLAGLAFAFVGAACGQGTGPADGAPADVTTRDVGVDSRGMSDVPAEPEASAPADTAEPMDTSPPMDAITPADTGTVGDSGPPPDASPSDAGAYPPGWLFTRDGAIYLSNGATSTRWMGRGVNLDDVFLCGYNNTLWMTSPDTTLETIVSGLMTAWRPTFVRVSLGMASYTTVDWRPSDSAYTMPMINVINAIGANPNVFVLVTLRSHGSMIGQDTASGDAEATGLPSDSTTTPNATQYPTGTDATFVALVDTFAHSSFVLFGLSNEPGGNTLSNSTISRAMSHAVGVIRAEEDRLGVPHHIVSVQGNGWTSDISFYATSPLPYDNIVYEVHGYPPTTASYTYTNIPVILGEYGQYADMGTSFWSAFYADIEAKQMPSLAWDFEPYSDCSPDLLTVTSDATMLTPSSPWGTTVQSYLLAHH